MIRKDKPQFFLPSFATHFYSYSSDVPTSKFGISIRRMEFFTGFLKFLRWAVRYRVVYISMNYLECQEAELIFQRVKGIFKFEMWFIDRRESVSLCLPGCSSLKFDVLWQGYTSFDDTRFSILYSCYTAICQACSLRKNWNFGKKLVPFGKFKFRNIERIFEF